MKILGIDPASTTGWGLIEDGKLIEFGSISTTSKMSLPQKLNFISNQFQMLLNRLNPDIIAIEDIIMAMSGVSVMKLLARISAVYILESYKKIQEKVELYEPSFWKAHSFEGLRGGSDKWEIQLAVVKHFNKISKEKIDEISIYVKTEKEKVQVIKDKINEIKQRSGDATKTLCRKRNPATGAEKELLERQLKELNPQLSNLKKELKIVEKNCDNNLYKICTDIYSLTGISSDIADSISIAFCRYLRTEKI